MDQESNNKRIAINASLLYVRMLILVIIGLYTSRVILNALGVDDYGLYNVIGGIVIMFSFVNYAMMNSTQRYITFALGKGDKKQTNRVFITSFNIHILISISILILAETIGLWFFYNKLNIPPTREYACLWVYQLSIITAIINVIIVPYNALIIAHEKMSAFAYISLFDGFAKLFIAYIISIISTDRLIVYSILVFLVLFIDGLIYFVFCYLKFRESHLFLYHNMKLTKEMSSFAIWSLLGNLGYVAATQGLNLLLNIFFNPAINAARAIAVQVQNMLLNFSTNIENAIKPQITKSYSINEKERFENLLYTSARFSFFSLLILSMPIIFETKEILTLWLNIVPEHTVNFIRIVLITSLIESLTSPLLTAVQANGKIKIYQLSVGSIYILILPFSYIVLLFFEIPELVFIVNLLISLILQFVKLNICCSIIDIKRIVYAKKVFKKSITVTIFLVAILSFQRILMDEGLLRTFITLLLSSVSTLFLIYIYGIENNERKYILKKIKSLVNLSCH